LLLLGIPLLHASENTGIKMTIQYGAAGLSSQQTIYLQGDRKRMEFRNSSGRRRPDGTLQPIYGPQLVAIIRCDLGQEFELNLDAQEYTSGPYPPKPLTKEEIEARGLQTPPAYLSRKPTLRIEIKTTDTGERKEIFGQIARHIITTRRQTPLEGSQSDPQQTVTDAWYIDLDQRLSCDRKWPEGKHAHTYLQTGNGKQPREKLELFTIGEPETGFALNSQTTVKGSYTLPDGTRKQSDSKNETQVTQLEEGPLDPALFEIPPGFKQVDHMVRNPVSTASASQVRDFWQRLRTSLARLFSR